LEKMKLISSEHRTPRDVTWHGRNVTPAIFKHPVEGRVALAKLCEASTTLAGRQI
jgi:hypothetical protein